MNEACQARSVLQKLFRKSSKEAYRSLTIEALMFSNSCRSTPSGLFSVLSRNGGITPNMTASAARPERCWARQRVTSRVPMVNPPSKTPVRPRCSASVFKSAAKVSWSYPPWVG
jgi:hypothetical protein